MVETNHGQMFKNFKVFWRNEVF